jgi:hypothetical protein
MAVQRRIGNTRMRPPIGNGNGSFVAVTSVTKMYGVATNVIRQNNAIALV